MAKLATCTIVVETKIRFPIYNQIPQRLMVLSDQKYINSIFTYVYSN